MKRLRSKQTLLLLSIVILTAFVVAGFAQQMPNLKPPPGYTMQTKEVGSTFNFYSLKRGMFRIPFDRIPMPPNKIPKGFIENKTFVCPSPQGTKYYNSPAAAFPTFGEPSRKGFQAFKGKGGDGVVLIFEYTNQVPMDAKDQLSKYFFKKTTPPDPNTQTEAEQFLVNDNTVIVWCFKNPKSEARQAHQKHTFELIGEVATAGQPKK